MTSETSRNELPVDQATAVRILRDAFDRVADAQSAAVSEAARLCADCLAGGGILQAFGTGHSQALSMEIAGRAGGLVAANKLAFKQLVMAGKATPEEVVDPHAERDVNLARRLWELHDIAAADVFIIASNSGGNAATVEMAMLAKRNGNPVIAVTSLAHSGSITSNHPSGSKLFEVADVVVDNCGVAGDSAAELTEGVAITPTSTVTGALIAQMIVTETCGVLAARGEAVPVLTSVNVAGGEERNEELKQRYGSRVMQNEP